MKTSPPLPSGTITFLLTDIERSTALWEAYGDDMGRAVERHESIIAAETERNNGVLVRSKGEGDSCFCVFDDPRAAVRASLAAQCALSAEPWGAGPAIRVRMAIHTGDAELRAAQYYGTAVNRCARLRGIGHGGQTLVSSAVAEFVGNDLPSGARLRDLGAHRLPDLAQPERVYQLCHPDVPDVFPPLASLDSLPNNLPVQLTRFVGRERELHEIADLLRTSRLVTITGPGGAGKTRLATQTAAGLLESFPDGVWLVSLGAVADPRLTANQIASTLGLREEPGRPLLETVTTYLASRTVLLVMDNCEHLVASAAEVTAAVLSACPRVRIIATSREALGVDGEVARVLHPLSVPSDANPSKLDELLSYDAVQLLQDRGALARDGFEVTEGNAAAVAQICRRLDGLPLAIEFAAARLGTLGPNELARRLDDRFRLLAHARRSGPERHETLEAAVDWSYELLADDERLLFRRLAVFAGAFKLEFAEAVCADDELRSGEIAGLVSRLVERSMIFADTANDETTYRMLSPIRSFALPRLEESGEQDTIRRNHLSWLVALAEAAEPEFARAREAQWLDLLTLVHGDIRAALSWGLEASPPAALRLAVALGPFWDTRGHWTEGRRWFEHAIGAAREESIDLALAYRWAGNFAYEQGEIGAAVPLLERALELTRSFDDEAGTAHVLTLLGLVTASVGDRLRAQSFFDDGLALLRRRGHENRTVGMLINLAMAAVARGDPRSADLFGEALTLSRENGHKRGTAAALVGLGSLAQAAGDIDRAQTAYEEALTLFRELGDKMGTAATLSSLAVTARARRDFEGADRLLTEALPLQRELGDRRAAALALSRLGTVAWARGELDRAMQLHTEALAAFREIGDTAGVVGSLTSLGRVARAQDDVVSGSAWLARAADTARHVPEIRPAATCLEEVAGLCVREDPERAARLMGAADAIRQRLGVSGPRTAQDVYDRDVAELRDHIASADLERAWAEGRRMDAADALAYAAGLPVLS